ncbi:MAG: class I SAM-dependent methyltransferase [Pseudomonadota bacterium]
MSPEGLIWLAMLAKCLPDKARVVEAGALYGSTAFVFASNAPSATVYSIDPWQHEAWMDNERSLKFPGAPKLSVHAFKAFTHELDNVVPIQGYAPDAYPGDEAIDLFFEDSTHTDPVFSQNMDRFGGLLKPGGILCGDDFGEAFQDVRQGALRCHKAWGRPAGGVRGLVWAFCKPGGADLHARIAERFPEVVLMEKTFQSGAAMQTTGFCFGLAAVGDVLSQVRIAPTYTLEARLDGAVVAQSDADGVLHFGGDQYLNEIRIWTQDGRRPPHVQFHGLAEDGRTVWSDWTAGAFDVAWTDRPVRCGNLRIGHNEL